MTKKHDETCSTPQIWGQGRGKKCRTPWSVFSHLSVPVPDPKPPPGPAEGMGVLLRSSSWGRFYWGPWQVPVISPRFARTCPQGKSLGTIWGRSTRILCQGDGIPVSTGHFMTVNFDWVLSTCWRAPGALSGTVSSGWGDSRETFTNTWMPFHVIRMLTAAPRRLEPSREFWEQRWGRGRCPGKGHSRNTQLCPVFTTAWGQRAREVGRRLGREQKWRKEESWRHEGTWNLSGSISKNWQFFKNHPGAFKNTDSNVPPPDPLN